MYTYIFCYLILLIVVVARFNGFLLSIIHLQDTLFPYAAKNVESYLNENWKEEATQNVVKDLVALSKKDVSDKVEGAEVIEKVNQLHLFNLQTFYLIHIEMYFTFFF